MPFFDTVVIDERKLVIYCLSDLHPRGRDKARVFRSRLGLTAADSTFLRASLLQAAQSRPQDLRRRGDNQYGQHYMLDFEMTTPAGEAMVRSIWIVRPNETALRLVSCFVR
jgi:hypothetical protein